jgi:hypothetical protein
METVELLARLPKPFYFNYFSLTYFPGVDLTERALRDGFIRPEDVEDVAQKGYHLWGGSLVGSRSPENLAWDVAYEMAVHGVPPRVIRGLMRSPTYRHHLGSVARVMRSVRTVTRRKNRLVDAVIGRPNLLHMYWANTNRDEAARESLVHPNFDNSPFGRPIEPALP